MMNDSKNRHCPLHPARHSSESWNPVEFSQQIPAFAGMTEWMKRVTGRMVAVLGVALILLSGCAELQEMGLDVDAPEMPSFAGAFEVINPPSSDDIKLLNAVPRQPVLNFRSHPHLGVEVQTAGYSRRPYFLSSPAQVQFSLGQCQAAFLAGDDDGVLPIEVENFLLIEVTQPERDQVIAVGNVEPMLYRGKPVPLLGGKRSTIPAREVRLERLIRTGEPATLTVTPLTNGDNGAVSDVYLVIEDTGRLVTDEATGATRCRPYGQRQN